MFKEKNSCFYEPVALLLLMLAMVCLTACSDNDDADAPANATEMKLIVTSPKETMMTARSTEGVKPER